MFSRQKNGFGLGFWVCHWRLQRSSAWGCFGSSFPKTPPSQFSEMNFRTVPEVHFFLFFHLSRILIDFDCLQDHVRPASTHPKDHFFLFFHLSPSTGLLYIQAGWHAGPTSWSG